MQRPCSRVQFAAGPEGRRTLIKTVSPPRRPWPWGRWRRWVSPFAALRTRDAQLAARLSRRTELILQSAGEGIYGVDRDGVGTFVNPAAARMLGWQPEDLIGRRQHEIVHHSRPDGTPYPLADCPVHAALVDGTVHHVLDEVFWRADGTSFPVEYISTPILEDGAIVGAVITFRDITERRRAAEAEREIVRLTESEEAQRRVIRQLQEALCPPMPLLDGTDLGLCYLPAQLDAPTGGDLYDVQCLPDGDLHLLVVDVVGKGLVGTKDALAVIHVVRSLVLQGHPLERIVERADELISAQDNELVATVMVGRYRPDTGLLRLAGGGHPPPLFVTADGHVRLIEASGCPIGYPEAGSDAIVDVAVQPGDTVLLYTDGLIESTKDVVQGLEMLTRITPELRHLPAGDLAQQVVGRMLADATRRDDTLALALRREAPPPDLASFRTSP